MTEPKRPLKVCAHIVLLWDADLAKNVQMRC